jgi:membrane protease YdiL (CAAX protease family)
MMTSSLLKSTDGRLRAGWRILGFILLLILLSVGGQVTVRTILGSLRRDSTLLIMIIAIAATGAVVIARRFIDKKSTVSLGLKIDGETFKDLLFGMLVSFSMAGLIFGVMVGTGLIDNVEINKIGISAFLLLLLPNILIGWWEEIVFRGYLLQNMAEGMGLRTAVLLSCILYGLVHAANPNAGLLSTAIIVLFGFLRIYGYLATKQLWLSIGMHTGWNFFQGPVFGYAASGQDSSITLFQHTEVGPAWLTGGAFGPEASLITIPVLALALGAMWAWSQRPGSRR